MPGAYKATHSQTWQNPQKLNLQSIRLRHNLFGADMDSTNTYPRFKNSLLFSTTTRIYFRDTALSIYSSADGQLDIDADTEVEITTTTLDINAAADVRDALTYNDLFEHGAQKKQTKSANYTMTAADSGYITDVDTDATTITLPATTVGMVFTIRNIGADGAVGINVSPAAADKIIGIGLTAAADKDLINTKATAKKGDFVTLIGNGVDGWFVVASAGTWAREA